MGGEPSKSATPGSPHAEAAKLVDTLLVPGAKRAAAFTNVVKLTTLLETYNPQQRVSFFKAVLSSPEATISCFFTSLFALTTAEPEIQAKTTILDLALKFVEYGADEPSAEVSLRGIAGPDAAAALLSALRRSADLLLQSGTAAPADVTMCLERALALLQIFASFEPFAFAFTSVNGHLAVNALLGAQLDECCRVMATLSLTELLQRGTAVAGPLRLPCGEQQAQYIAACLRSANEADSGTGIGAALQTSACHLLITYIESHQTGEVTYEGNLRNLARHRLVVHLLALHRRLQISDPKTFDRRTEKDVFHALSLLLSDGPSIAQFPNTGIETVTTALDRVTRKRAKLPSAHPSLDYYCELGFHCATIIFRLTTVADLHRPLIGKSVFRTLLNVLLGSEHKPLPVELRLMTARAMSNLVRMKAKQHKVALLQQAKFPLLLMQLVNEAELALVLLVLQSLHGVVDADYDDTERQSGIGLVVFRALVAPPCAILTRIAGSDESGPVHLQCFELCIQILLQLAFSDEQIREICEHLSFTSVETYLCERVTTTSPAHTQLANLSSKCRSGGNSPVSPQPRAYPRSAERPGFGSTSWPFPLHIPTERSSSVSSSTTYKSIDTNTLEPSDTVEEVEEVHGISIPAHRHNSGFFGTPEAQRYFPLSPPSLQTSRSAQGHQAQAPSPAIHLTTPPQIIPVPHPAPGSYSRIPGASPSMQSPIARAPSSLSKAALEPPVARNTAEALHPTPPVVPAPATPSRSLDYS
eukprot:TRINITY_DN7673_c0_g1_i1.p1 TRINITY_DN7673_c0_g1~~TRINITY_DN7673_c0_g1_i1.p1  ORF type:complete len:769 (+),score=78.26 TRINITY_DN7673_c0_g1_i1:37-2307(+)